MRRGAHRFLALVARLLLGTLLFAHTVLAAQPCLSPAGSMTAAFSAAMPEGCAAQGKNACLASCLQASQASDTKWLSAPPPVASGPILMVVAALASPLSEAPASLPLPRPDIPLCIRNCRLLN